MAIHQTQDMRGKRNDILRKAGELFLHQGYTKTSIRQITGQLDISLGLVSYYFSSKKDLAQALFEIEHQCFTALVHRYVCQKEDPVLFTGTLTKLQMTVFSTPVFRSFYLDALREDIISNVIIKSGLDTFHCINEKYNLGYSDDYLALYGNYNAIALERVLLLYGQDNQLAARSIPDTVFKSYMKYLYGDDAFLEEYCRKSDVIVSQILKDYPSILDFWMTEEDTKLD